MGFPKILVDSFLWNQIIVGVELVALYSRKAQNLVW